LRFLVRILGYLLVAAGFVVLLTDGARAIANSTFRLTPLGESAQALVGERILALQPAIERNLHPVLWDPVMVTLLRVPSAAAALLLGFLLLRLGAARRPDIGILTRH